MIHGSSARIFVLTLQLGLAGLLLAAGGCAGRGGAITLQPENNGALVQEFPAAYVTSPQEGEYDVVLVSDAPTPGSREERPGAPLQPQMAPPVRHLLQVHVYWQPRSRMSASNPAATNASLNWYVMSNDPSAPRSMIRYEGAGMVLLTDEGRNIRVEIVRAQLRPRWVGPDMTDALGSFQIDGAVDAAKDDDTTRTFLAEVGR